MAVRSSAATLPAGGGTANLIVETSRECPWSARADVPWITLSGAEGQGPATVAYTVAPNPVGLLRRGAFIVSDQRVDISQEAAPCVFEITDRRREVDNAGGEVSVPLTATEGCAWTAKSSVGWVDDGAPSSGTGSATIRFSVATNSGGARSGTVTVAGLPVTIAQRATPSPDPVPPPGPPAPGPPPPPAPPTCTVTVSPSSRAIAASGGDTVFSVTAQSGCAWTTSTGVDWIRVADGPNGSGSGSVRLVVSPNSGPAREAIVTIGGNAVSIAQQAAVACTYSIRPTGYESGRGPDDVRVQVSAPSGCSWTTVTNANWVNVAEGRNGTGDGAVRLVISANNGAPRTTAVTIAGLPFTLTQAGQQCTNTIDPTSRTVVSGGTEFVVTVNALPGCTWTATSDVPWITVAGRDNGSGGGSVRLVVDANTGAGPRSGTVRIAGQTLLVQQEASAACVERIKPTSYDASRGRDDVRIDVKASDGCAWTVTNVPLWVTVAQGSTGVGDGHVRLIVEANSGAARSATIMIGGQPFSLTQTAR